MQVTKFSPSGEFLAVSGTDGHLRIWETATNKLLQEYIPSSHLSATCTCLDWAPEPSEVAQKGKKKKKKRIFSGDVVVLGTAAGSLLFYDVTKSQALTQSSASGCSSVNGVTWSDVTLCVYTCGEAGRVHEWDAEKASVADQWTIGNESLTSIQAINNNLLVAGQSISLWDLKTKTVIASFTGHPGQINHLAVIPTTEYFVSMSHNDRNLHIWQNPQSNSGSVTKSLATLSVPEFPQNCNVFTSTNGTAFIVVTTKKGALHLFQHKLNGRVKKPLVPTSVVKILDGPEGDDSSEIIPFLEGFLTDTSSANVSVCAAYGTWLKLRFENLLLSSLKPDTVLTRELSKSLKSKSKKKSKESKLKEEEEQERIQVPNDVKHLQPGTETLNKAPSKTGKKRKQDSSTSDDKGVEVDSGELPMEERLTNLTIDAPVRSELPQGENLAHLLSQGLHSKDSKILQSVLYRWDEKIIMNTVRSIPVELVLPLLQEIKIILTGKSQINHSVLKWLRAVFQFHSSYLMSCPSNDELMGPLMSLLRAREILYPQMCLLKGKLELIKGHVAAKQYKADIPNTALLTYQDESTDDEDANDDTAIPSESEDFLTSDDLGVDDENSEEDSDSEAGDGSESSGDEEGKEDNDDDSDEEMQVNGSKLKMNGKLPVGSSEEESMDED